MPSPSITPQQFAAKWRGDTRKERSVAQEHFIDLCRLLGHETPGDNRDGTLAFEAGVDKQKGGQGWADVWKQGAFAWEYKGPHADLGKAYQQIQQYRESLQNPPLLIVCDIQQIVIHTNFTNTVKQVFTITLDDLLTPAGQQRLRDTFYAPDAFRAPLTTEQVTKQAAQEFSELAKLLRRYGEDPQRAAHFLIRLLFCLFAEDIGLLPNGLFSRLISSTRKRAPLFASELGKLFAAMASGGFYAMEDIPHFNGHLFDDADVLELDSDGLDILARVSTLDWSSIEPAILGTLFERSLDPSKRSQLGAHYTSKEDILLIVEPVLMAPLRRRWQAVQAQARDLAAQRDGIPDSLDRAIQRKRASLTSEINALLAQFDQELSTIRVLDPACGSGNFLYVALRSLLDLEKAVITFAGDLGAGSFFPNVSPEQLRGIEVNDYAYELAQITVWIGYIQWLADNGYGRPAQPILKPLDTIKHMDAILAFDADGKPVEPEWPEADVIVGNPPFLGGNKLRRELGNEYTEQLWSLYNDRVPGGADLVTYWFERARALNEFGKLKRAGLLATQGIRGGANRKILESIKQTGDIFFAWSDRNWVLDGAAVHVSMVGFDNGSEQIRILDGHPISVIHANLSGSLDASVAQRLPENYGIAFLGTYKIGAFDISDDIAQRLLSAPLNPNGRPNSDVVYPWVNGLDITRRPRNMWIIDFRNRSEEEAADYELPFEYIRKFVKPERDLNRRPRRQKYWWQHGETSPGLYASLDPLHRFIGSPGVSKHRLFVWLSYPTIPDHQIVVIVREDDYFLGILQSKVHELWARQMGTQVREAESGFRYTLSTTFETYPFPWPPGREPADDPCVAAIGAAARELVEKRDRWLNPEGADAAELKKRTLTNLYNQRPTWLDLAHKKLDRAVLDAYGWPHDIADEEILARLLALNLERAAGQGQASSGNADGGAASAAVDSEYGEA
jgi:type II restriction/modification system DNA methylase subunit YeeA